MYQWDVRGGTIEPDDAQTVVWTAPETAVVAWIHVDVTHADGGELRGHGSMTGVANAECAPRPATIQTVAGIGPVPHLAARTPRRWEATPSTCSASRCRSSPGLILRCLLPELDVRWRRPRPLRGRLHSTPHKLVDVLTHLALVTPRRFFQAIPAIHQ